MDELKERLPGRDLGLTLADHVVQHPGLTLLKGVRSEQHPCRVVRLKELRPPVRVDLEGEAKRVQDGTVDLEEKTVVLQKL